jgi:antitoxin MazE
MQVQAACASVHDTNMRDLDLRLAPWCYNVITMKHMQVTIRRIGNSQGIVIPKPVLAQVGLEGFADMTIEQGALVLRRPARPARDGWSEAARHLAESNDDSLVMDEFSNQGDSERTW